MKKLEAILQGFQYANCVEFFSSVFPSVKYGFTFAFISCSGVLTCLSQLLGLNVITIIAFVVLTLLELLTGIYASVAVRKEKFKSLKASRFTIKLAAIMIVLFVLHSFEKQYHGTNNLAEGFFEWLYFSALIYFAMEYLVSVLENYAVISGKNKSLLIAAIKRKLNRFLELEEAVEDEE